MIIFFVIFPLGFCNAVSAYDECSYYDHTVPCTLPGNSSIILDSVMGNAAGMVGYFVGACYEETDWYNQNGDLYADLHAIENPIPEGCAYYHVSKSYLWLSSNSVFGGFGGANFLQDSGFFGLVLHLIISLGLLIHKMHPMAILARAVNGREIRRAAIGLAIYRLISQQYGTMSNHFKNITGNTRISVADIWVLITIWVQAIMNFLTMDRLSMPLERE